MDSRKIRILMVLGNTGRGGSQAYAMNILRNIDRNKFAIDFAVYNDVENGFGQEMRDLGSKVLIVPEFKIFNYLSCKRAWGRILSSYRYDIIHAHATNAAFIFLKIAKNQGITTISHSHNSNYRGKWWEKVIKKYFSDKCRHYADYWFSCSELASRRLYYGEYKDFKNYYELPNAIIVERYKYSDDVRCKIRNSLGVDDNTWLLGHVGSFSIPKNHRFLFEIFREVLKQVPTAKLLLCGDGPLRKQVLGYIDEMGLDDNILRVGNVSNVWDYMMAMDVNVFPSLFEGFPVTLIEAQASGLPIVMSDTITEESHLTDLITTKSLEDSVSEWSKAILNKRSCNRIKYNELIAKTRFNMSTSINTITSLYLEMANGKNDRVS